MNEPQIDRPALARVVAIINGKGGVLKTTLAANVGGLLAASGYRILLVDLDPQGNLADDLGYTDGDGGRALASALMFGGTPTPMKNVRPSLDVHAAGPLLDQATAGLAARAQKDPKGAKLALATLLSPVAADYDLILIDCPPGDETLQTAALAAARWALVPVKSDASSRKGLTAVSARLDAVVDLNPHLDLAGVVLVSVGTAAHAIQREARANIAELFGSPNITFTATVRHSEATAQATRERGMLVHELDAHVKSAPSWVAVRQGVAVAEPLTPKTAGSVADDLQAVAQELIARITRAESEETR